MIGQQRTGEILECYAPALRANGCDADLIAATEGELAIGGDLAVDFKCAGEPDR